MENSVVRRLNVPGISIDRVHEVVLIPVRDKTKDRILLAADCWLLAAAKNSSSCI